METNSISASLRMLRQSANTTTGRCKEMEISTKNLPSRVLWTIASTPGRPAEEECRSLLTCHPLHFLMNFPNLQMVERRKKPALPSYSLQRGCFAVSTAGAKRQTVFNLRFMAHSEGFTPTRIKAETSRLDSLWSGMSCFTVRIQGSI